MAPGRRGFGSAALASAPAGQGVAEDVFKSLFEDRADRDVYKRALQNLRRSPSLNTARDAVEDMLEEECKHERCGAGLQPHRYAGGIRAVRSITKARPFVYLGHDEEQKLSTVSYTLAWEDVSRGTKDVPEQNLIGCSEVLKQFAHATRAPRAVSPPPSSSAFTGVPVSRPTAMKPEEATSVRHFCTDCKRANRAELMLQCTSCKRHWHDCCRGSHVVLFPHKLFTCNECQDTFSRKVERILAARGGDPKLRCDEYWVSFEDQADVHAQWMSLDELRKYPGIDVKVEAFHQRLIGSADDDLYIPETESGLFVSPDVSPHQFQADYILDHFKGLCLVVWRESTWLQASWEVQSSVPQRVVKSYQARKVQVEKHRPKPNFDTRFKPESSSFALPKLACDCPQGLCWCPKVKLSDAQQVGARSIAWRVVNGRSIVIADPRETQPEVQVVAALEFLRRERSIWGFHVVLYSDGEETRAVRWSRLFRGYTKLWPIVLTKDWVESFVKEFASFRSSKDRSRRKLKGHVLILPLSIVAKGGFRTMLKQQEIVSLVVDVGGISTSGAVTASQVEALNDLLKRRSAESKNSLPSRQATILSQVHFLHRANRRQLHTLLTHLDPNVGSESVFMSVYGQAAWTTLNNGLKDLKVRGYVDEKSPKGLQVNDRLLVIHATNAQRRSMASLLQNGQAAMQKASPPSHHMRDLWDKLVRTAQVANAKESMGRGPGSLDGDPNLRGSAKLLWLAQTLLKLAETGKSMKMVLYFGTPQESLLKAEIKRLLRALRIFHVDITDTRPEAARTLIDTFNVVSELSVCLYRQGNVNLAPAVLLKADMVVVMRSSPHPPHDHDRLRVLVPGNTTFFRLCVGDSVELARLQNERHWEGTPPSPLPVKDVVDMLFRALHYLVHPGPFPETAIPKPLQYHRKLLLSGDEPSPTCFQLPFKHDSLNLELPSLAVRGDGSVPSTQHTWDEATSRALKLVQMKMSVGLDDTLSAREEKVLEKWSSRSTQKPSAAWDAWLGMGELKEAIASPDAVVMGDDEDDEEEEEYGAVSGGSQGKHEEEEEEEEYGATASSSAPRKRGRSCQDRSSCELCGLEFNSSNSLSVHLSGKKHKAKVAQQKRDADYKKRRLEKAAASSSPAAKPPSPALRDSPPSASPVPMVSSSGSLVPGSSLQENAITTASKAPRAQGLEPVVLMGWLVERTRSDQVSLTRQADGKEVRLPCKDTKNGDVVEDLCRIVLGGLGVKTHWVGYTDDEIYAAKRLLQAQMPGDSGL